MFENIEWKNNSTQFSRNVDHVLHSPVNTTSIDFYQNGIIQKAALDEEAEVTVGNLRFTALFGESHLIQFNENGEISYVYPRESLSIKNKGVDFVLAK